MSKTVVTTENGAITSVVSNGVVLPPEEVIELGNKVENGKVAAINETENNQPENSQQVNSQTSTSQQVNSQPTTSNGELEKLITNLIIFLNAIKNQYKQKLFSAQDISKIKTVVTKLQTLPGYNELFNPAFFSLLFGFFTMETFHDPLNIFTKLIKFFEFKDPLLKFLTSEKSNNNDYTKLENVLSDIVTILKEKKKQITDILPLAYKIAIGKIPEKFIKMLKHSKLFISFAIQFVIACINTLPKPIIMPPIEQSITAGEYLLKHHKWDLASAGMAMTQPSLSVPSLEGMVALRQFRGGKRKTKRYHRKQRKTKRYHCKQRKTKKNK